MLKVRKQKVLAVRMLKVLKLKVRILKVPKLKVRRLESSMARKFDSILKAASRNLRKNAKVSQTLALSS